MHSAEELRRLSKMLDQALDMPEAERSAWIDSLQGDAATLGPTLRRMLEASPERETADLLSRGPQFTAVGLFECAECFAVGDTVGPYLLVRELGRGGMGHVWLADRRDGNLKRQIALKLPVSGLRRGLLVERFARERDILASLTHPNIARLYDAGVTSDGQPFMALEYVHGRSLTSYCDGGKLDITHRIGLVLQVLDAVQYAHSRLVIHRDLKPGNILVTEDAQVKLLDFGIAKLLADEKGESAEALTQVGAIAFTPDYASPEQVRGESLGTASDVYSLGVVLYELLCGHRPHKRGRNPAASLTPDPPQGPAAPSQRVDSATAPLRQLPPRELQRQLRGDLDTIVLKALKFDPAARYPTVVEFAADLRRFLAGEPVLARPDSLAYRAFKFSRRNRGLVASTLSAVTAVSVGLGVSLWQYRLKSIEAENARAEAKAAQAVQQFMQSIFSANSMDVEQPQDAGSTTARELLNHAAESASTQSMESPHARVKLLVMLGYLYMQVHELSRALKMAELALQTAATIDPEGLDMAESLGIYGVALDYSYRTDEAETVARQRLALR